MSDCQMVLNGQFVSAHTTDIFEFQMKKNRFWSVFTSNKAQLHIASLLESIWKRGKTLDDTEITLCSGVGIKVMC